MSEVQLELFTNEMPICKYCKSESVRVEAWAVWNKEKNTWELDEIRDLPDSEWCDKCNEETDFTWILL